MVSTQTQQILDKLKSSPSAYTPNVAPTERDISLDKKLASAQGADSRAKSDALKERWYSSDKDKEDTAPKDSYIGGVLKGLGAPMSAGAGAVEHLLGKGTESSLLGNIKANVDEQGTYGDIMRSYGISNLVSAPLGFALDVALDPINWATMGTTALVPKIAYGAKMGLGSKVGVLGGMKAGAKAGVLQGLETAGKFVPGLGKRAFKEGAEETMSALPKLYKKIATAANKSRVNYDLITNQSWKDMLSSPSKMKEFTLMLNSKMDATERGRYLKKVFGYSDDKWWKAEVIKANDLAKLDETAKLTDIANTPFIDLTDDVGGISLNKISNKRSAVVLKTDELGEDIATGLMETVNPNKSVGKNSKGILDDLAGEGSLENISYKQRQKVLTSKPIESLSKVEVLERQRMQLGELYTNSGIKAVDDFYASILQNDATVKTLTAYSNFIGLFRTAKIGGNLPTAMTNAMVGNLAMTSMAGINIADASFYRSMNNAYKIIKGNDLSALQKLVGTEGWEDFITQYPDLFKSIFSLDSKFVLGGKRFIQEKTDDMIRLAKGNVDEINKISKDADEAMRMFDDALTAKKGSKVFKKAEDATADLITKGPKENFRIATSPVETAMGETKTTFLSQEILTGPFTDFVRKIEQKADAGSLYYKAMHKYLTVPMDIYSKTDQLYRLGLSMHLTNTGIGEKELKLLHKAYNVLDSDVIKVADRNLWKFKPAKATELASKIYMNYQAMPSFVKIMRNLPVLGAPFISFAAGMVTLATRTAAYNPSFYNKVQYALKEISGQKSPLEKEALDSKYYEWLDQPGMLKLPFFKDNPVYLNMENMLPYYTMNIFQPSQRNYKDSLGGKIGAMIDKTPFFATPEGQVLLDYIILPSMTGESTGSFGQQLYPKDATLLEKAGYTARGLAESVVPPAFSAPVGLITPEAGIPYLPSYRARSLGFAARGKSSVGVDSSDPAIEKTAKALSSIAGWPTYKINLHK